MLIKQLEERKHKGSITIEAAAILPIFLIGFLALISIGIEALFEIKLSNALYIEARELSVKCWDKRSIAISQVEGDVERLLGKMNANDSFVDGGLEGIYYGDSKLDEGEYIVICAKYNFVPFGANLFGLMTIPVKREVVMHSWCGYEHGYFGNENGEYVYVTEESQVYHRDRECSHITLSIKKVTGSELDILRNNGGAKYYSCEICHSSKSDPNIYITEDGNRFHNSVTCSGLKRTVKAIRIENIGDRRPCSRCGK